MNNQTKNQSREPSPNRYASVGDALRWTFSYEVAVLKPSWVRSVLSLALVPLMSVVVESAWPISSGDRAWLLVWAAPLAVFVLNGWLDESFPL